ncbi:MAG: YihY/virulence factor BrkB family protein [Bacteroidota bacterium]|nr:YihY/virulence factor BrkB family protein [Bacteroidota bacterium]
MKKRIVSVFSYLRKVFKEFSADNILKYSASLAYYTVFSIAPLLVIVTTLSGIFFGKKAVQGEVYAQLNGLVGNDAALQIQDIIKNIHLTGDNFFASIVSIVILLIGATTIFGEVQDSLNKIWGLRVKTKKTWWKLILTRLLSFSLIVCIGFVMIVSLVLNALVSAFGKFLSRYIHNFSVYFIETSESILSFLVTTFLFSIMFKVLPDAKIKWKDVFFGGFITALFFTLGKLAIGFYLGQSNLATLYGAAGSIIIIMVWVYYSAIILYLGAEFTKVHAKLYGGKIQPNEYAEWIKIEEKHVLNAEFKNKELN